MFDGVNDITPEAPEAPEDDAYDLVISIASGTVTYHMAAAPLAWLALITSGMKGARLNTDGGYRPRTVRPDEYLAVRPSVSHHSPNRGEAAAAFASAFGGT